MEESLIGEESAKVRKGARTALRSKAADWVTLRRTGLGDKKEEMRVMPILRAAVVQDDQVAPRQSIFFSRG